jgi:hypothetical protein
MQNKTQQQKLQEAIHLLERYRHSMHVDEIKMANFIIEQLRDQIKALDFGRD